MNPDSVRDPLKSLRAKVQTLRRQVPALGDDATWRDFQALHAGGCRSTRAMTIGQLEGVVAALHRAGAPRLPPQAGKAFFAGPQMAKARALWIALADAGVIKDRTETALTAFVKRQIGPGMDLGRPSAAQARKVIEALKAIGRRHGLFE